MSKLYALLVGINDYSNTTASNLKGCLADIAFYETFLRDNYADALRLEVLRNGDATRKNTVDLFRSHLGRARRDDVALFVYAGHGARWKSAESFETFYPDGYDEGLVLYDSRSKSASYPYDFADKEIAWLIHEAVVDDEPHFSVILDCCHSGSATRSPQELKGEVVRATERVQDTRPLDSYLEGQYSRIANADLYVPSSRHILLAACKRSQSAYETRGQRGAFSWSLQQVLEKTGPEITYAELFSRCRATMRDRKDQEPQFQTFGHFNGYTTFLGSKVKVRTRHRVYFDLGDHAWKVECGALHDLPSDAHTSAELHLFGEEGPCVGFASTSQVGLQTSVVQMPAELANDTSVTYRADVTSIVVQPSPVYLHGDAHGVRAVRDSGNMSFGVYFPESPVGVDYGIEARNQELRLTHLDSHRIVQRVKGYSDESATLLLNVLRHVLRWERTLALQNHATRMSPAMVDAQFVHIVDNHRNDVYELRLVDGRDIVFERGPAEERAYTSNQIELEYTGSGREEEDIRVRVYVRNRTEQEIHCMLLAFSKEFGVAMNANEPVPPNGRSFMELDRTQLLLGDEVNEETGWFKLIVSTEKIDDYTLTMDELELGKLQDPGKGGLHADVIRSIERRQQKTLLKNEWFTQTWEVRLVRQAARVGPDAVTLFDGKLRIGSHPRLRANLCLPTVAARSAASSEADMLAALTNEDMQLISLTSTRDDDGLPLALEFSDIQGDNQLAENPLEISLRLHLDENQHIVPLSFDGNHFLLVGDVTSEDGETRIRIGQIPDSRVNRRSLGKALKLYFLKVYLRVTEVNTLGWVRYRPDGGMERGTKGIEEKVSEARSILLLIHGIIGDTKSIAEGLGQILLVDGKPLHSLFDLVLTYDYENLTTPIAETGRQLRADLQRIGVHSADRKDLVILAHSMGGLVSRWLIEREHGNEFVNHLVMCGTPNHGSPFGKVANARKIAGSLATLAINYIPAVAPFAYGILVALNRSRRITPTLEEMKSTSKFLSTLNSSPDPHIPYSIVAGNVERFRETSGRFLPELIDKIGKSALFDLMFSHAPHDLAVEADSIKAVNSGRQPPPLTIDVACHHLNYFLSDSGHKGLADINWMESR